MYILYILICTHIFFNLYISIIIIYNNNNQYLKKKIIIIIIKKKEFQVQKKLQTL